MSGYEHGKRKYKCRINIEHETRKGGNGVYNNIVINNIVCTETHRTRMKEDESSSCTYNVMNKPVGTRAIQTLYY